MRNTGDKCGDCGMPECECRTVALRTLSLSPKNKRRLEKKLRKGSKKDADSEQDA